MLKPIGNKIIVIQDPPETITKGGIVLPDTVQEHPLTGTVIAVGSKVREDIKPGDKIMFGRHSNTEIEHDGVKYQVVIEGNVTGVFKKQKAKGNSQKRKKGGSKKC
jgi:chaperonin GroES